MTAPFYETDAALSQYLLFHYGKPEEVLPFEEGPRDALNYPIRCVTECLDLTTLPAKARALDLGCAVGRSAFELARFCESVIGIDFSAAFIRAAGQLRSEGQLRYRYQIEGDLQAESTAEIPPEIPREKVRFEVGDAMKLSPKLGTFDVVLMANLIDRLRDPRACLDQLPGLVRPNGQLIITSPYTWTEEYTPKSAWLCSDNHGAETTTQEKLAQILEPHFNLTKRKNLPFLIREHARKYQWSLAEATIWRRRS
jgi:putative 4-mercaptohistidine N1-methyltranferase